MKRISVVIVAYNEEENIESVLKKIPSNYEIIIVDDYSSDSTALIANKYANVLKNPENLGYEKSLKKCLLHASGNIIITMDADAEHDPNDIKRLLKFMNNYDFVIGERSQLPRISEYFMAWLVRRIIPRIKDPVNGFRVIKKEVIQSIKLDNMCFGANLLIRAYRKGFKIRTVKIQTKRRLRARIKFSAILKPILLLIKEVLIRY